MNERDEKFTIISNQEELEFVIEQIKNGPLFAGEFKFTERSYFIKLLETLDIDYEKFEINYFFFDNNSHLHISESQFGYVWISTYGLIAKDKATSNKFVNACINQYIVISLLLDKAIELSENEKVFDVDGHSFGQLSELSPALFHNYLFYVEVFCKAYISLNNVDISHTHKLSVVYKKMLDTMFLKKQNDSLFHVQIADKFASIVDYITTRPGNFKEQFVKYDDNKEDTTVIIFQSENLRSIKMTIDFCQDFIYEFLYTGNKTPYLESGFLQKALDKAKTDEQRANIAEKFGHLVSNSNRNILVK
jgi:hypothetical protein